jgi:dihydroneopterin aldolase
MRVTYFFRSLAVQARLGLLPQEKAAPQRVLIDLEYDGPAPSDGSDTLASVLDYDAVRREVVAIVESRHFNLQETLCRTILTSLTAHPEVSRARVFVRKPDIYPDVDAVGVEMEMRKP